MDKTEAGTVTKETSFNFDLDFLLELLNELTTADPALLDAISAQPIDSTRTYEMETKSHAPFCLEVFMDDIDSPDVAFIGDAATIDAIEKSIEAYF